MHRRLEVRIVSGAGIYTHSADSTGCIENHWDFPKALGAHAISFSWRGQHWKPRWNIVFKHPIFFTDRGHPCDFSTSLTPENVKHDKDSTRPHDHTYMRAAALGYSGYWFNLQVAQHAVFYSQMVGRWDIEVGCSCCSYESTYLSISSSTVLSVKLQCFSESQSKPIIQTRL